MATDHESRRSRRSAYLYLVLSHVGTGCLIAAFFLLAKGPGSLAFADLLGAAAAALPSRGLVFVLFLVGFGVKAGVVPLHVWLPEAHPAAPSSVSALMSGGLVNAGLYGIVRVGAGGLGRPDPEWGMGVLLLGSLSAVLGVLYALSENDLKRLLAFSTIENCGIALMAIGCGMIGLASERPALAALGLVAGLYHVLNHAAFKGLLFLGAGGVVAATGTRRIEELGGLIHRMPRTAGLFLLGSAAIAGLPLLNGFASEWLVFQALLVGFFSAERLTRVVLPARRRAARPDERPRRGVLREGVRPDVPRPPAQPRGGARRPRRPRCCSLRSSSWRSPASRWASSRASSCERLAGVTAALPGIGPQAALAEGLAGVTSGVPGVRPRGARRSRAGGRCSRSGSPRRSASWRGAAGGARRPGAAAASCRRRRSTRPPPSPSPSCMVFRGIYRPTREVSTVRGGALLREARSATAPRSPRPSSSTSTDPSRARCSRPPSGSGSSRPGAFTPTWPTCSCSA